MFVPPRCPNVRCPMHAEPRAGFYRHKGYYQPKCRPHPVPRFKCRACNRGFSRQTFRMDYYDHKPHLNTLLMRLLCNGSGLRKAARFIAMTKNNTEAKFRKIGRHCRRLNVHLRQPLGERVRLQFDEFETYEGRRSTRPVTLPMAIERDSRLLLYARAAPIRPSGPMPEHRRRAIAQDERRYRPRRSRSSRACTVVLGVASRMCAKAKSVLLETDRKSTYPAIARRLFGERLVHSRTPSRVPRYAWNPLFPINHSEAIARDLNGRLRRESWLVSKKLRFLNLQLAIYAAFRNFAQPRFNRDKQSPAQFAGWMPRMLSAGDVLSWRQVFGRLSGHPLARNGEAIEDFVSQSS